MDSALTVGVVGSMSGPQVGAGRAADGHGAEVLRKCGPLLDDVFLIAGRGQCGGEKMAFGTYLEKRHVLDRVHVQILVVGQDEEDVWLLGRRESAAEDKSQSR